ncbi:MAG: SH3 domain-containing protein [Lachnospiraceae bacterium]|nr:SH3 domain-containing protein [Lachnospiraceae bacterium]
MANKNRIQEALGEVREHLILGKYNEAMMLMAQITMDMIEHLTDEALIVSKGYEEDLKTLRANGIIADDTAHNFETLIISGVQAHNGVDIPKEHAEQALQVLTNELDVIFKNDDINPSFSENLEEKSKFNANTDKPVFEYDEDEEPYPGDFSKDMTVEGSTPAFMQKGDDGDFRKKERMRAQMLESERKKVGRKKSKLVAIIIPIVLILLIVFVVRGMFFSEKPSRRVQETTAPIIETTEPETTETEPTTPPLPPEAGYYDVTGDLVKIRDAATTEGSKVLGTVSRGGKVQVKSFYNSDWAVILFEGKDAYISRRYIKKDESLSPVFEEQ